MRGRGRTICVTLVADLRELIRQYPIVSDDEILDRADNHARHCRTCTPSLPKQRTGLGRNIEWDPNRGLPG